MINFDFGSAIPEGATIVGIEVRKYLRASSANREYRDDAIYLRKTSGQMGDNKALPDIWCTVSQMDLHGGSTDLWSTAWSRDDIVTPDFGIDISIAAKKDGFQGEIYYVQVRVYYNPVTTGVFKVGGVISPALVAGGRVGSSEIIPVGYALKAPIEVVNSNLRPSAISY